MSVPMHTTAASLSPGLPDGCQNFQDNEHGLTASSPWEATPHVAQTAPKRGPCHETRSSRYTKCTAASEASRHCLAQFLWGRIPPSAVGGHPTGPPPLAVVGTRPLHTKPQSVGTRLPHPRVEGPLLKRRTRTYNRKYQAAHPGLPPPPPPPPPTPCPTLHPTTDLDCQAGHTKKDCTGHRVLHDTQPEFME